MPTYRERLWPSPWLFLSTALVIPASVLVFAPISLPVGIGVAIVLYGASVVSLVTTSPLVEVANDTLRAGRAEICLDHVGEATGHWGPSATAHRGPSLDARAWLLLRGTLDGVVVVPIVDPDDAVPYWAISTRHPRSLASAINGIQDQ